MVDAKQAKLEWALDANDGTCSVFPVWETLPDGSCACGDAECKSKGKHPAIDKWKDNATRDAVQIIDWWTENPTRNIGRTPLKGYVYIDLDKKPAQEAREAIGEMGKEGYRPARLAKPAIDGIANCKMLIVAKAMTDAPRVKTPRSGRHLQFTTGDIAYANSQSKIAPGIDVRGPDGYVLAPGSSIFINGVETFYEKMNEAKPQPLPKALADKMGEVAEKTHKDRAPVGKLDTENRIRNAVEFVSNQKRCKPSIDGEGGNGNAYAIGAKLQEIGISVDRAIDILMNWNIVKQPDGSKITWNESCDGPWDYDDLLVTVQNAFAYGQKTPGTGDLMEGVDIAEGLNVGDTLEESEVAALKDKLERKPDSGSVVYDAEAAPSRGEKPTLYLGSSFLRRGNPYVPHVIPGFVVAHGYTLVGGPKRHGKTTAVTDMVLRIANDMDYYGRKTDKGWTVGYVAAEDDKGVQARFMAWARMHGGVLVKDEKRLVTFTRTVNLQEWEGEDGLKAAADEFMQATGSGEKNLLVIDTYGRCLFESQSDEAAALKAARNLDKCAEYIKGAIKVLAQPSRDGVKSVSGSLQIENFAQGLLWVQRAGPKAASELEGTKSSLKRSAESTKHLTGHDTVTMEANDMKNGLSYSEIEFQIQSVTLDEDARDIEGNKWTGAYASVVAAYDTKKKLLKSNGIKTYVRPDSGLIHEVENLNNWDIAKAPLDKKRLKDDLYYAKMVIAEIYKSARDAGYAPEKFKIKQSELLKKMCHGGYVSSFAEDIGFELLRSTQMKKRMQGLIGLRGVPPGAETGYILNRVGGMGAGKTPSPVLSITPVGADGDPEEDAGQE